MRCHWPRQEKGPGLVKKHEFGCGWCLWLSVLAMRCFGGSQVRAASELWTCLWSSEQGQAVRTWCVLTCLCALVAPLSCLAWKSLLAATVESRVHLASLGSCSHTTTTPSSICSLSPPCSACSPCQPGGSWYLNINWRKLVSLHLYSIVVSADPAPE